MSGKTVYLLHMERNAKSGLPGLWGLEDSAFGKLTHSGDAGSGTMNKGQGSRASLCYSPRHGPGNRQVWGVVLGKIKSTCSERYKF